MDFYTTFLDIAGIPAPKDRVLDGISLKSTLLNGTLIDRLGIKGLELPRYKSDLTIGQNVTRLGNPTFNDSFPLFL